jgi:hypothetical protein
MQVVILISKQTAKAVLLSTSYKGERIMRKVFNALCVVAAIALVFPIVAFPQDIFEGSIQGASYVLNQTVQPISSNDPAVRIERDFVLLASDGSVYFLPNVPRNMKIKAVNKEVMVYGKEDGAKNILVHHINYKINDRYVALCNYEERMKELNSGH